MAAADSADGGESPTRREYARTAGRALALGGALAALGIAGLLLWGATLQFASEKVFAVAALVFGFSLLGWSGSVFAGSGIESFQQHIGGRSDWSEADSRRAMVVLGSVGAGGMVGASLTTAVVGALV